MIYFLTISGCLTKKGIPCLFPWVDVVKGLVHTGCLNSSQSDLGDWCPTEVNEHGKFEPKSGKWGDCNDNCPSDYSK